MQRIRCLAAALCALSAAGCYSPLRMSGPLAGGERAEFEDGIVVFLPKRAVLTYRLDRLVNQRGVVLEAACESTLVDEIAILPDTTTPYRVALRVPVFGSAEAGVELSQGMLTQVSLASDAEIPETIGAVAEVASALRPGALEAGPEEPQPGRRLCNAGRRLVAIDGAPVAAVEAPGK